MQNPIGVGLALGASPVLEASDGEKSSITDESYKSAMSDISSIEGRSEFSRTSPKSTNERSAISPQFSDTDDPDNTIQNEPNVKSSVDIMSPIKMATGLGKLSISKLRKERMRKRTNSSPATMVEVASENSNFFNDNEK